MNNASDILVGEHKLIERALEALSIAADRLEKGDEIGGDTFLQFVDFIRHFADRCHHAKEENILFRLMVERGIPSEGGPIGVMLTEHDSGRDYTKRMESAANLFLQGDVSAKIEIITNARKFVELLRGHIYKEDNILYPMGERIFSAEDQLYLIKEFERVESDVIGLDVHQKYLRMVEELEIRFSIDTAINNHTNTGERI